MCFKNGCHKQHNSSVIKFAKIVSSKFAIIKKKQMKTHNEKVGVLTRKSEEKLLKLTLKISPHDIYYST